MERNDFSPHWGCVRLFEVPEDPRREAVKSERLEPVFRPEVEFPKFLSDHRREILLGCRAIHIHYRFSISLKVFLDKT